MENNVKLQTVQAQVVDRVSGLLSEHFEHFVIAVVPGGGGDPLGQPEWVWRGNRCLLTGVVELAKLDMATNTKDLATKKK